MPPLRTIETFLRAFDMSVSSIAYVMLSTPFFQIGHSEWSNFQKCIDIEICKSAGFKSV